MGPTTTEATRPSFFTRTFRWSNMGWMPACLPRFGPYVPHWWLAVTGVQRVTCMCFGFRVQPSTKLMSIWLLAYHVTKASTKVMFEISTGISKDHLEWFFIYVGVCAENLVCLKNIDSWDRATPSKSIYTLYFFWCLNSGHFSQLLLWYVVQKGIVVVVVGASDLGWQGIDTISFWVYTVSSIYCGNLCAFERYPSFPQWLMFIASYHY